jgi:DNA-binding transcriptional LysR family regulator
MRFTHVACERKIESMESIYLKTLVEVARAGNITKAAEILAVTQSAASRRIKFMEDQYGQPLLDRSGPVLKVTPAGSVVLEQAQKILEIERDLLSKLHLMERRKGIALVCTPTFGVVHLPEILREFMLSQAELGDLKFVLEMPEAVLAGLKDGRYELAVIEHCQCLDLAGFDAVDLVGDEMVFAASPALGLGGPETTLDRMFTSTLYTRSEGCCSRTLLQNNLANMGKTIEQFRQVVVFDDLHVIVNALMDGRGVAFISSDLVRAHVASGRLREHRIPGFTHVRKRTLVLGGGALIGPAAAFVGKVLERLGPGRAATPLPALG